MRFLLPPDRGVVRVSARAAVIADWMSGWLGDRVEVEVAPSYLDLARAIERAEVDLAWTPPAVCSRVRSCARSFLTAVRARATSCRAALIVRKAGGIERLADLTSKRASWVDPLSTSGHLSPLAHLRAHGLDPKRLFSEQRFAGSYRDAMMDVVAGRADVASLYFVDESPEATMRELQDLVGSAASALALLATTEPAPYDALVVPAGSRAPSDLEERILSLHARMRPPAMLLEVCRADRFERTSAERYAAVRPATDDAFAGA